MVKVEIGVVDFKVGMSIAVVFTTPDNGRPTMNLMDDKGNNVLHVNPRWDEKSFVLNSKIGGNWGSEERPGGFDFREGRKMKIIVKAKDDHFVVKVDGDEIHKYKYRAPVTDIAKVVWYWDGSGKEAKIRKLMVVYD